MADDQQVTVSFSPPDQWRFARPRTPMARPARLTLAPDAPNPVWRFEAAEVVGGGDQFAVDVDPGGARVVITARGTGAGAYEYRVVVSLDGSSYASPPQSWAADGDDPEGERSRGRSTAEDDGGRALSRRPPQITNEA